jgi:hypothetical protein
MFIADPGSGFFSIPDPGVIKATDTGFLKTEKNTYDEDEAMLNNVHYDQKKKM